MNNCPKCGNPLQVGVSTCPICGTNVESAQTPVATGSVANETKNQNVTTINSVSKPIKENEIKMTPTPNNAETVNVVKPVENVGSQQPINVQPVSNAPVNNVVSPSPVQVANQPVQSPTVSPVVEPVAPTVAPTVTPVQVAPTVTNMQSTPSIPSSLNQVSAPSVSPQQPLVTDEPKKGGKFNKKAILVVAVVVILLVGAVGGYMMLGHQKNNLQQQNNQPTAVQTSAVISNGYKFNLEKDWSVNEDGENVVVINDGETIFVKLAHSNSSISQINKDMIEGYIKQIPDFKETTVEETKISAKDAYVVNSVINNLPVQIYFINGGSNLLLGVMVVYQSNDTKSKYEANVTELVGSISYADESAKAITTLNMYNNIFSLYNGIINSSNQSNSASNTGEQPSTNDTNDENTNIDTNTNSNTTPNISFENSVNN